MNHILLIGNLGASPEGGYTDLGKSYANFSIATHDRWVDQAGQKQERTEWTRIVLWGRTAEIAMQYLKKGSKIAIQGSLRTRTFTGKDGVEKKITEVVGNNLEMLDSNGNGGGRPEGERTPVDRPAPVRDKVDKPTPTTAVKTEQRPTPSDSPFSDDEEMFPEF